MSRLKKSKALQRVIRCDDVNELGKLTLTLAAEAVQEGRADEAIELINYGAFEAKTTHDSIVTMGEFYLNYLVNMAGEEVLEKIFRGRYGPKMKGDFLATIGSVEDNVRRFAEAHRGHQGNVTITEEADRYVVTLDPCGSGGKLRRTQAVGVTKKAYPWAWNKIGIPYYCAHCCMAWEIIPIEVLGYPIKIGQISDRPEDPCVHYFYKRPELVPEEYFTRIGKKKPK